MAGGHMKYRHLSVKSSHRQALLRNLATSLLEHESITTTYAKAKEAQRFVEKLITLGKRNTEAARNRAKGILFQHQLLPKLFGPLRERYASRPGGYTRVLHIEPHKEDQSPSAILELVDGPRDIRFMMTAKTLVSERSEGRNMDPLTSKNVEKVTKFRADGQGDLEKLVKQIEGRMKIVDEPVQESEGDGKRGQVPNTRRQAYENRRKMGERKERVYYEYELENRGQPVLHGQAKERRKKREEKWRRDQLEKQAS